MKRSTKSTCQYLPIYHNEKYRVPFAVAQLKKLADVLMKKMFPSHNFLNIFVKTYIYIYYNNMFVDFLRTRNFEKRFISVFYFMLDVLVS